jgi:hypothetical protein
MGYKHIGFCCCRSGLTLTPKIVTIVMKKVFAKGQAKFEISEADFSRLERQSACQMQAPIMAMYDSASPSSLVAEAVRRDSEKSSRSPTTASGTFASMSLLLLIFCIA